MGNPLLRLYSLFELGKVIKAIFLYRYLASEELRREVHEGLNVVESWSSTNGFIFHGKAGELATNRRENQEISLLCPHLLLASMAQQFVGQELVAAGQDEPYYWALEAKSSTAELCDLCRGKGVQGSNTDFLMCAVAVRHQMPIFTTDVDFSFLQQHLPIKLHRSRLAP
jgi:hypothetical protein